MPGPPTAGSSPASRPPSASYRTERRVHREDGRLAGAADLRSLREPLTNSWYESRFGDHRGEGPGHALRIQLITDRLRSRQHQRDRADDLTREHGALRPRAAVDRGGRVLDAVVDGVDEVEAVRGDGAGEVERE